MAHTKKIIVEHAKSATANGGIPVYLTDEETGKKLCAVWRNEEQRYANAMMWANAPQMYSLLKDISAFYQNTSDENQIACRIREVLGAVDGSH